MTIGMILRAELVTTFTAFGYIILLTALKKNAFTFHCPFSRKSMNALACERVNYNADLKIQEIYLNLFKDR